MRLAVGSPAAMCGRATIRYLDMEVKDALEMGERRTCKGRDRWPDRLS